MIRLKKGQQELFEKRMDEEIKVVSQSPVMQKLLKEIKIISKNSSPVLILGANGSGKKMIAKEVFYNSIRNNKKLVIFNSSGVTPEFIDHQLFSSEACLNDIEGKTLLIQSVDSFPLELQSKLLRFLKNRNGDFYKFRILCTANEMISQKIENGEFREDLFRYLSQSLLIVPSLVERREDISKLVGIFLKENSFTGSLDASAMNRLKKHNWKGNVIELRNVCFQIASLYNNEVVKENQIPIFSSKELDLSLFIKYNPRISLDDLINYYISQSLVYFKSKKKSAESLNISVKTIYNKIKQGVIKE